jgi:hypothetical protein
VTTRFCPGCRAEVEDTGGFCLLGHRLAHDPPVASLKALREETDASFEGSESDDLNRLEEFWAEAAGPTAPVAPPQSQAPVNGSAVVSPAPVPVNGSAVGSPAPGDGVTAPIEGPAAVAAAPAVAPVIPATVPSSPGGRVGPTPTSPAPTAPQGSPGRVPPPPPPPPAADRSFADAIPPAPAVLPPNPASPGVDGRPALDPIAAFAPAPRMDWGPEKGRLSRLRLRPRRTAKADQPA